MYTQTTHEPHQAETGTFQKNLQQSAMKKIMLAVLLSCVLFLAGQSVLTLARNEQQAVSHMELLEDILRQLDEQERAFLLEQESERMVFQILTNDMAAVEDTGAVDRFKNHFRRFQENCEVHSSVLITDDAGQIVYTSLGENQLTSYLINYNNAVCYNAKNSGTDDIYRAVYYDVGNYADTMYVKPILDDDAILGYITLFLSGSEWNFYLWESNFDGVITDQRQNVMYTSRPSLIETGNKFYGISHGILTDEDERYWVISRELPSLSAKIYSLVYYPKSGTVALGLLILIIMGIIWYFTARWMAKSMAENNAAAIGRLVREIRIIRKEDPTHRIFLETDDEFSEVAYQVNHMLDHIQSLNDRNTELIRLNSRIEMEQLTAQMNPHFLYNTLEIIRNLAIFDAEKAGELITQLTDLLRYSASSSKGEVTLKEDMSYIARYLDIQNCRFGKRFQCHIQIDPCCETCVVPRLTLQPLIENSIKYGFRKNMYLKIEITAVMEGRMLVILVRDDGPGMEEAEAEALRQSLDAHDTGSASIGLRNLSRRLHLRYGSESGLQIRNRESGGFEVEVHIEQEGAQTCTG